jgi:hypothetical protein
MGIMIGDL